MEIVVNEKFLFMLAFVSLNAGAALFASDEEKEVQVEVSNVADEEAAAEEASVETAPSNCGCSHK